MEVMKMAAGDDYKDDDDDDDGHGGRGGGGEYSPTNRSEHSYELYVGGEGAERQGGSLQPQHHRRMSVFTEEDEEEALAAAVAMAADQQEGRDRRVSESVPSARKVKQDAPSGRRAFHRRVRLSFLSPAAIVFGPSWKWNPPPRSLASWWAPRSRSFVRASE